MQRRSDRNRKRSKRRAIYCPKHGCYLDSVSQKYSIYTDQAEQLQQRGIGKRNALMLTASQTAVVLSNEWLEAFWCAQCQKTEWYYVRKVDRTYNVSVAPQGIWQQAIGVNNPEGNPSVGEFTLRHARMNGYNIYKQFKFMQ